MAVDESTLRSRRAVLATAAAAAVGSIAHALGAPQASRAANGDPVVVGESHAGTAETAIAVTGAEVAAIRGTSPGGVGIVGTGGTGVYGETSLEAGLGVAAKNTHTGAGATGLYAHSPNGVGIHGHTLAGTGVAGGGTTGVAGLGWETGVRGQSTSGTGVLGTGQVGVHASASSLGFIGLKVDGRAVFELSGTISIATGKDRASSQDGLPVHPGSVVVAVVQTGDGKAWVRKVVPKHGSFTVIVNKTVSRTTRVAWIAFG